MKSVFVVLGLVAVANAFQAPMMATRAIAKPAAKKAAKPAPKVVAKKVVAKKVVAKPAKKAVAKAAPAKKAARAPAVSFSRAGLLRFLPANLWYRGCTRGDKDATHKAHHIHDNVSSFVFFVSVYFHV